MCEQTDQGAVVVLFCFYFHFTKYSLKNGAVYKFHEGKSVLYLDGQGAYADTRCQSAISLFYHHVLAEGIEYRLYLQ